MRRFYVKNKEKNKNTITVTESKPALGVFNSDVHLHVRRPLLTLTDFTIVLS